MLLGYHGNGEYQNSLNLENCHCDYMVELITAVILCAIGIHAGMTWSLFWEMSGKRVCMGYHGNCLPSEKAWYCNYA